MFQSPYDHHQGVFFKYILYEVVKICFLLLLVRDVAACVCMLKLLPFAPLMFLPWAELFLYRVQEVVFPYGHTTSYWLCHFPTPTQPGINTTHNPATDILHSHAYEDGTDSEFRNVGN